VPAEFEATLRGRPTTAGSERPEGCDLYSGYCASCHQPSGAGTADGSHPSLFHNTATGSRHAGNVVAAILFGVDRASDRDHAFMPGFKATSCVQPLDDAQVLSVTNYVLRTFGDPSVQITIDDVAAARGVSAAPRLAHVVQGLLVLVALALYALGWWGVRRWQRRARP